MRGIGIDIGSTATKVAVLEDDTLALTLLAPTGFSSVEAAEHARQALAAHGIDATQERVVATGYGRIAVPYASRAVTEITCHAKGAWWLFHEDGVVIDAAGPEVPDRPRLLLAHLPLSPTQRATTTRSSTFSAVFSPAGATMPPKGICATRRQLAGRPKSSRTASSITGL